MVSVANFCLCFHHKLKTRNGAPPGSDGAHVIDVTGSGDVVENVMLPETSSRMNGLVVGQ